MNKSMENMELQGLPNFDLSVIIPLNNVQWTGFIQKFPGFERYYQRNGIEVILAADKSVDKVSLLKFVKSFSMIDWKVIRCDSENSMQMINAGIDESEKKYVLLLHSDLDLKNDIIYVLRKDMDSYDKHYAIGQIENGYKGGILVRKEYLNLIGGLDETIISFIVGFDNLQKRMELAGINKLYYPDAILVQNSNFSPGPKQQMNEIMLELLLPVNAVVNNESYGYRCYKLLFNWRDNPFASEQCHKYLNKLGDYKILNPEIFTSQYKLIALVPTFNESKRIGECLKSVEKYCDGIIILDDGSTDDTYEIVKSEKLLLKAQKKRNAFNDKKNRNILLDIAYFFRAEWFIFIDADEQFDDRFVDLSEIMQDTKVDVSGAWVANLWDSMETYRTNMQESNKNSKIGLWFRWRMFRNKGRMQIITSKTLHFLSIPYRDNPQESQTLLLHMGYLTSENRIGKYNFYKREDHMNQSFYSDILEEEIEVAFLSEISKDDLIPFPLTVYAREHEKFIN